MEPHRQQYEFLKNKSKFRAFVGGVGAGKTKIGVLEGILYAGQNPGSLGMIVAPSYRMMEDVVMRTFRELCPENIIKEFRAGKGEVEFKNNAEIIFRSADEPERLRGPNLAWFYIDEAALVDHMAWKIMVGRLRQIGFNHRGWIATTPKGFNWIYREFAQKPRKDYALIFCSSRDNPFLPSDFVSTLEASYVGAFAKQEIEGLFVAFEGLVFQNFSRFVHVIDVPNDKQFKEIVYGIDWGFSHPSVCLAVGFDGDGRAYVLEEIYQRGLVAPDFIRLVKDLQKKHGKGRTFADPSEPGLIQEFNNKGVYVENANNEVMAGIQRVAAALGFQKDKRPGLFVDRSCVNTIMEFESYRYPEGKDGKAMKDAPLKIFDDCLVAGTLIETSKGPKPIETVKKGDLVLTRKGYKKVKRSWMVSKSSEVFTAKFSDGRELTGTDDHRVWVKGRGWIELDALRYGFKPVLAIAERSFRQTSTRAPSTVHVLAVVRKATKAAVYDLTVEDCHEFFANGILVHNCMDACRYVMSSRETGRAIILDDPDHVIF